MSNTQLEMGIGCSCLEDDGDTTSWHEKAFTCIIAVANYVETKTIVE